MSSYDNPNQEVVRGSGPGIGQEGKGGTETPPSSAPAPAGEYDSMTKAELLAEAQARGISPANNDMTKDELKAALEAG